MEVCASVVMFYLQVRQVLLDPQELQVNKDSLVQLDSLVRLEMLVLLDHQDREVLQVAEERLVLPVPQVLLDRLDTVAVVDRLASPVKLTTVINIVSLIKHSFSQMKQSG